MKVAVHSEFFVDIPQCAISHQRITLSVVIERYDPKISPSF